MAISYQYNVPGWVIWVVHILIGLYLIYLGWLLLNRKPMGNYVAVSLFVLGVLALLYHLHIWALKNGNGGKSKMEYYEDTSGCTACRQPYDCINDHVCGPMCVNGFCAGYAPCSDVTSGTCPCVSDTQCTQHGVGAGICCGGFCGMYGNPGDDCQKGTPGYGNGNEEPPICCSGKCVDDGYGDYHCA